VESATELLVVGAGPAGSSAARVAASRGIDVLLVDRLAPPRPKLCGGALSEQAMSYLGEDLPSGLIDSNCLGARVRYRDRVVEGRLPKRIAVMVCREGFDHYLATRAIDSGAQFLVADARAAERVRDGLLVSTSAGPIRARVLIVAQGATGRLVRLVRPPDGPNHIGVCVEHRFPVESPDRFAELRELVDIHFGVAHFGYGWLFHHGSFYSVGVGGVRARFPKPVDAFHAFAGSLGFPRVTTGLRSHLIPCGGVRRPVVADRVLLAGDSAGFVDPFYGEGLAFAIRSGQLAAEVVADALRDNDLSLSRLDTYSLRCEQEFGRELRYSLALARISHAFPGVFLRLLSSDRSVLQEYLRVPSRDLAYSSYLRWLLMRAPFLMARDSIRRLLSM
jgi:geranylgeranyl reductase family protein